jgi:DNA-binding MarR family transcriptional regulator
LQVTSEDRFDLADEQYERLADLRYGLRRFLSWSAEQAKAAGLTPAQHQLLLAIRASRDPRGPSVGEIASTLLVRHHSAVGLVDRAEEAGLIVRERDRAQPTAVRLRLTEHGAATLRSLSELHLRELHQLAPTMRALWAEAADGDPQDGASVGTGQLS